MKLAYKEKAIELRKAGYSYSFILTKVPVSKSTLSYWFSGIPFIPNKETILKIGNARAASAQTKTAIKNKSIEEAGKLAKQDVGILSRRDVFMLGIGLYLGEGTKTHGNVRIVNANPKIIKFAIRWFKETLKLGDANFKIRIHLYPDNNIDECLSFWSKTVKLPMSQFEKVHIDIRKDKKIKKLGKLPYGTAHLKVKSNGVKELGIFLSRRINGWIEEVLT